MDALHRDLENFSPHVFTIKEEDYVMMLVSTYGENEWTGEDKIWKIGRERKILDYPEMVKNNHQHKNAVEYHKKMFQ